MTIQHEILSAAYNYNRYLGYAYNADILCCAEILSSQ